MDKDPVIYFHLQGRAILTTVIEALTARGLGNGNIVLLGSESGSIGVVAYLDELANQFPQAQLFGISEGGWTDYALDTLANSPGLLAQNQSLLAFVGAALDESCALAETELAHCMPNPMVATRSDCER